MNCIGLKISFLGVFSLFLVHFNVYPQHTVTRIESLQEAKGKQGIIYTLPMTSFNIEVLVLKEEYIRGPLADFAEKMLGIDDIIKRNEEVYSIERISVEPFTKPDPGQMFLVAQVEKSENEILVGLSEEGYLSELYLSPEDEKGISRDLDLEFEEITFKKAFPGYQEAILKEERYSVTRVMTIDTFMFEQEIQRRRMVLLSEEEKAREAADIIEKIKEDKYNLLVGYQETAYEKEALEYMIDRLEKMEFLYLSLFTGTKTTQEMVYAYTFTPSGENPEQQEILFNFSSGKGITEGEGDAVTAAIVLKQVVENDNVSGSGVVYRIPAEAELLISLDGSALFSEPFMVNQAGPVVSLPANSKEVVIDPKTGNIRKVMLDRRD